MSISEAIISILEKLSTLKIAAPAALSSFILLIPTFIWLLLLKSAQIFQIRTSSSSFSELTSKIISIFAENTTPELSTATTTLSIIFIVSLSFLMINFIRDIKDVLKQLNNEAGKSLKKFFMKKKRQIAQAKNLQYILHTLTDDNINIVKLFHHENDLIQIGDNEIKDAIDLIEKYKLIEMVSESPKNTKYFRLNKKYNFFVRKFLDGELNEWISNKEYRLNELSFLLSSHSVFSSLFDIIYYILIIIISAIVAMYFIVFLVYVMVSILSAIAGISPLQ